MLQCWWFLLVECRKGCYKMDWNTKEIDSMIKMAFCGVLMAGVLIGGSLVYLFN